MSVADWLKGLDLGQYAQAFADNDIDLALAATLTDADLKEIGVASLGHRRKLLAATAALTAEPPAPQPTPPPPRPGQDAERRPITVMFCDLVGSTSLAARLDAEDWRNLVGGYLDEASRAVTSLGGHVLKKLGDGLMALFGYPQAQENDGERAVRAALAIQRALAELNARNAATGAPELAARIGLESGRVVVDHTGEVYGEAPNVAARVQSAAAPGEIWITQAVHRQIAGLFVAEDKGEHELKGVPEKTQLYRIVRVSGGGRRGGSRAPTPLVGRGEELDILARRWERARRGEGQLALITGEPGLGKSRLIEEFRARLAETPHTWVEWASSQLLQNTPLHPIAEWGRARFGGAEVAGERQYAELEAALGSVGLDAGEYAPLLAPLVDAPTPPGRAPKLSPEELRSRQLAALTAWVLAGARTQPLVLAFEDLHWADPTSLDVLQALAERGAQASLLIIATTRPEFRPPWKLRSHHGVISLAPLDVGEVARMIGEISTLHALSKDVIAGVSERSGGVPLFVEEVTRLLLERGEHGGVQAIPPTLQQSLAARLDRLGPAREIAQIGAVLGRGFSYALLKSVAAVDDRGQTGVSDPGYSFLDAALEKLADAELLFVEGVAPNANYRFKHALIQDAAYDSLLKSRRQTLHRRAAEVLLASPAPEAEALAHHFTLAGQTELAIEWWGKAGDQALRRSAFAEAISHLGKAIELSDKGGQGGAKAAANPPAPTDRRLKLQTSYGLAMGLSKGFAAEETKAVLSQTLGLTAQTDNVAERMKAHYARWIALNTDGQLKLARELAETYVREANLAGDPRAVASAKRTLGMTCFYQGLFEESLECLQEALRLHDLSSERSAQGPRVSEAEVSAKSYLAQIFWFVGDVAGGGAQFERALSQALASEHAAIIANAYAHKTTHEMVRCDVEATTGAAEMLLDVSEKNGLRLYENLARACLSWGRARRGVADELGRFRELGEALIAQGFRLTGPLFLGRFAELEAEHSSVDEALTSIDRAIDLGSKSEIRYLDSLLHRIRGDILRGLHPDDPAAAVEAYLAAIAVAREQGARSFGLQAALRLAKLYQSTARLVDARDILASALEGFSPTPEFPQIAEAKALFEALAANETVKADAARRAQRLKLQTEYGQAVMWGKGFAADETKDAFARAAELATRIGGPEAPLDAYVARWAHSFFRGELGLALVAAESLMRGAERAARPTEAATGNRLVGFTRLVQGDFAQARERCEQALRIYDPERDREAKFRLGVDTRAMATIQLALAAWHLGELSRAAALMDEAVAHAAESAHVPTIVGVYLHQAWLEDLRDDAEAAQRAAEAAVALCREHGLSSYLVWGALQLACARAKIGDSNGRLTALRQALADYTRQGNKLLLPFCKGRLAETEAEREGAQAALAVIDEALALAGETGEHWFDAAANRIRGEILLKQNPADPAPAEAAFLAAVAVAQQQKARSFELRAALSLAKLYQSTGRPIDAHDVLGPALAGFSPTPEFPQIAEAKALFAALAADEWVKAEAVRREQRLKLQTNYGQAVLWAKGYAAEETKAAYARVEEVAGEKGDLQAPLDAYYGRWGYSLFRGELGSAQETADSFLREAERAGRPTEAGVGHRLLGITFFLQGDFGQARAHCEHALRIYDPDRDRDAKFRLGQDSAVGAAGYLGLAAWCVGDVARARALINEALARAVESAHAPTQAGAHLTQALLEILRDDAEAVLRAAESMVALCRDHGLALYLALGALPLTWARAKLGDRDAGPAVLRQTLADYASQGSKVSLPLLQGLLAEIEAEGAGAEPALAGIDETLALAGETGEHWFDAALHRIRGEILVKQNPADPAPAEAAFLAAIAVAQQQKARSFELRAALSLAKLYQSAGRPIDAHDVLGSALAGFSPTPEFPQIAEAKALFDALSADDTVKADAARRAQRLKLQTDYGQAVMWSKGYVAEETKAAYARAGQLVTEKSGAPASLDAYYARWGHYVFGGEIGSARETAESFLRDAEGAGRATEVGVAHRLLGIALFLKGDFAQARAHCEQALRLYDPDRDREAKFHLGTDSAAAAAAHVALTAWCGGDVARARELMDEAVARAIKSAHAPTCALVYYAQCLLEMIREDAEATRRVAEASVALSREHGLSLFLAIGSLQSSWARAKLGDQHADPAEFRLALSEYVSGGNRGVLPFHRGLLAEIEVERGYVDAALVGIDGALAVAGETGEHWFDAGLHRIRGEILLKQNPADPAAAEAAFLAAIAVAQQQKARSFELRAALSLAKLYQSTGRPIDAHDVLGPALAGFSPTPEFPQIAEAKALSEALAGDEGVKAEAARRAQRLKLQTSYGQAVMWSKGYAAEETKAALARVGELATEVGKAETPLDAYHARFHHSLFRGELGSAVETAESFLRAAEHAARPAEIAVAHRLLGTARLLQGDFPQARARFDQTLRIYEPDRDREAKFRLGPDSKVAATSYLATAAWCLGDVARARELMDEAVARAVESAHAPTLVNMYFGHVWLEFLREDAEAVLRTAETCVAISREHGLAFHLTWGALPLAWARAGLGDRDAGSTEFRRALADYASQGNKLFLPIFQGLLAEIETETEGAEAALAGIDEALALAGETGEHWFDAALHRIRGEILVKQNPADPAPAEAAFLAAIAVAQQQKARSFELRAALSLAELYQSAGRPIDAHDVLGPALAGFSPTPEFPTIAEAKALFEATGAQL